MPKDAPNNIYLNDKIFVHWGGRNGAPYGGVDLEWNRTTGESDWEKLSDGERVGHAFSFHFNHSVSCEEIGMYPVHDKDVCQTAFDQTGLPPHKINNGNPANADFDHIGPDDDPNTLQISDDGGYLIYAADNAAQYAWSPIVQEHSHEWIFVSYYSSGDVVRNTKEEDTYGMMGGDRFERGCQLVSGFPKRWAPCQCWALEHDFYGTPRLIYNDETNNGVDDTLESGTSFRQDPMSSPWEYKPALVSYCSKTPGVCQGLPAADPSPPPPPLAPEALRHPSCYSEPTEEPNTHRICKCSDHPAPPPPPSAAPQTPPPAPAPPGFWHCTEHATEAAARLAVHEARQASPGALILQADDFDVCVQTRAESHWRYDADNPDPSDPRHLPYFGHVLLDRLDGSVVVNENCAQPHQRDYNSNRRRLADAWEPKYRDGLFFDQMVYNGNRNFTQLADGSTQWYHEPAAPAQDFLYGKWMCVPQDHPTPPPSPPLPPPPPLPPHHVAAFATQVNVGLLASATDADATLAQGAIMTAIADAVHAVDATAQVQFFQQTSDGNGRRLSESDVEATIIVTGSTYPGENSWKLECTNGFSLFSGNGPYTGANPYTGTHSVPACTTCTLYLYDSYSDGWNGNTWSATGWSAETYSMAWGRFDEATVPIPPLEGQSCPPPPSPPPHPPYPPSQPPPLPPSPYPPNAAPRPPPFPPDAAPLPPPPSPPPPKPAYDCDGNCNDAACGTEPTTQISYRVVVETETYTQAQMDALEAAIAGVHATVKAAIGADALCYVGDFGTGFKPVYGDAPPPSPPPPPPPSSPTPAPPPSPPHPPTAPPSPAQPPRAGQWTIGHSSTFQESSCDRVCSLVPGGNHRCDSDDFAARLVEVDTPQKLNDVIQDARMRAVKVNLNSNERDLDIVAFGYDELEGDSYGGVSDQRTTCYEAATGGSLYNTETDWAFAPRMVLDENGPFKCAVRAPALPAPNCSLEYSSATTEGLASTTGMKRVCWCTEKYAPPGAPPWAPGLAPVAPPPPPPPTAGRWTIHHIEGLSCTSTCAADGRTCNSADFLSRLVEVNTQVKLIGVINDVRTRAVRTDPFFGTTTYHEVAFGYDEDASEYDYDDAPPSPQTTCQGMQDGSETWSWSTVDEYLRAPRMLSATTMNFQLTSADWNSMRKCAVRPPEYNQVMDCDLTTGSSFRRICWCSDP